MPLALSWAIAAGHDQADDGGRASRGRPGPCPRWTSDLSRCRIVRSAPGARAGRKRWSRGMASGAGRSPQPNIHARSARLPRSRGRNSRCGDGFDGFAGRSVQSGPTAGGGRAVHEGESARHASHLSRRRAPGRRHRPGAVAGGPPPGRGAAGPARFRARSTSAWRTAGRGARRCTTRPSRRSPPTRVALKHPTTTAEESPNAILRRRLDLSVIHRPVYTIPGVPTNFRRELDLDIVRIATGGTYDDPGRMIGEDGAVSLRIVERRPVTPGGPVRVQPGPQDRQAGHQLVEVHDPEGDRRPVRAGHRRRSPASSPRCRTRSSCSTRCWAR